MQSKAKSADVIRAEFLSTADTLLARVRTVSDAHEINALSQAAAALFTAALAARSTDVPPNGG